MQRDNVVPLRFESREPRIPLLVLVDLQQEYVSEGRLHHIGDIAPALANCRKLVSAARFGRWPIANVRWLRRGDHFNRKLKFSDWIEEFRPQASDMVFEKSGASSFSDSGFSEMMEQGAGDVVVLAGLTGALACLSTAVDGAARGHRILFASDASASLGAGEVSDRQAHSCASFVISQHATVADTTEIIRMFAAPEHVWAGGRR
jgi:nicotinamidase-related amidase